MHTLLQLANFFLGLVIQFFLFLLIVRFILKFIKVDWRHPTVAMAYRYTDPIVTPLQKFLRDVGVFEASTFLLIYLLTLLKIVLNLLVSSRIPESSSILLWAFLEVIVQFINFYIFAFIAQAALAWFKNSRFEGILVLLNQITDPILKPIRKIIPSVKGFDLSPLVAILILLLIQIILIGPMITHAMHSVVLG